MKISRLKRTLAVFLSAAMLLMCMPFTGITAAAEDGWTEVSSATELTDALAGTDNIKFTSDISIETLSVERACEFDLNSKTLTITLANNTGTNADDGLIINTSEQVGFKNGTISISPGGRNVYFGINKMNANLTLDHIRLTGSTSNSGVFTINQGGSTITLIDTTIENTGSGSGYYSVLGNRAATYNIKGNVSFINATRNGQPHLTLFSTLNIYGNLTTTSQLSSNRLTLNFFGGSIKYTGTGSSIFSSGNILTLGDPDSMTLYSDSGKSTPITDVTTLASTKKEVYSTYTHVHNWTYSASGSVITAKCKVGCPISPSPKLTLKATPSKYSGSPCTGASTEKDADFPGTVGDITYTGLYSTYYNSTVPPTNAGIYKATVTIDGQTATASFSIQSITLNENNVTLSVESYDYEEGTTREPTVTVKANVNGSETTLTKDTDYTISGVTSASDASTGDGYEITIKGKGNFSGTVKKYWKINKINMAGVSASDISETYDPTKSYEIEVTGEPTGSNILYGESADSITSADNFKYTDAGEYTVYYTVTNSNYNDFTDSATITINKADYAGTKTAETNILAGVATENATVALPEIPDNMSYGTITFSSSVTAAFISGGVLTFSTDSTTVDSQDYTITVPIVEADGAKANYKDYKIIVTLKANDCTHGNVTDTDPWESNADNHWHICPDCNQTVDISGHTPDEAVKENEIAPTCTEEGSYDEVVYCSVCGREISRTAKTVDAEGHREVIDPAVAPTCTETGLTEGSHCSVCDEVIVAQEEVPALGHNFENGECTVCGETDPNYTSEPDPEPVPDEGDVIVETEDNVGGAGVDGEEVKNAVEITEEEQALIDSGYDLHIILNVKNADSTVSDKDKAITESALSEDMKVGMYLDITLFKQIGELETAIHTTNTPITITFAMPESIINANKNVTREYSIIRVHNGVAEILSCTFDPETGMASFMTDKFSSYAIAYKDTVKTEPASEAKPEIKPEIKYPITVSGDVVADKPYAAAGDVVNVNAGFGYDIIVTDGNGNKIAVITEKGSFKMPASKVHIYVVRNSTLELMSNSWRHSYVYSYDADMNKLKVNSDVKRGVIVIDLGVKYAGCDFTIYSGRKSTKTEIISGTLDENGKFTFKADEGKNYTLVVE